MSMPPIQSVPRQVPKENHRRERAVTGGGGGAGKEGIGLANVKTAGNMNIQGNITHTHNDRVPGIHTVHITT